MSDTLPLPPVAYKVLADIMGSDSRGIFYRPYFAHAFGGAANAILLSQFWFWANTPTVQARGGGWFWKTQKEITLETGLTRTETETARRKLIGLGVLEMEVRGVPATVHFRINKDALLARLWQYVLANPSQFAETLQTAQFGGTLQARMRETRKLVRGNPASKNAGFRQTITDTTLHKSKREHHSEGLPSASSEKTTDQQAIDKAGAAKLKAALESARKGKA